MPSGEGSSAFLTGERVFLLGSLDSMSRKEAARILRSHGALVASAWSEVPTLLVHGDAVVDWREVAKQALPEADIDAALAASLEVVAESALWDRLGLVNQAEDEERFYSPAHLAELVGVPLAAIRRWVRRGYLNSTRKVGRLVYLGMTEVHAARTLAALLNEGCSQARIDKLLAQLGQAFPDIQRPLVDLAPVVQEGRLFLRQGDDLREPQGQLLLDFEARTSADDDLPAALPLVHTDLETPLAAPGDTATMPSADFARALAYDRQASDDTAGAIEACRAVLLMGGDAEDHFMLAELLYRLGEPAAARERYYMALELDEEFVEARVSLGCVLRELGDGELALAALQGAVDQQPDFADARYHLAHALDDLGHGEEALDQWRSFIQLAPESPWTEEARSRLGLQGR